MCNFLQSANEFEGKLNRALEESGYLVKENRRPEGYQEAPLAYDAVWAVALGKNTLEFKGICVNHLPGTYKKMVDFSRRRQIYLFFISFSTE